MKPGAGTAVRSLVVHADEGDLRVDRWFKLRFPALPYSRVARLLRTGQIRIDGRRGQPGDRLAAGQTVRVPPLERVDPSAEPTRLLPVRRTSPAEARLLVDSILYRDDAILALNKPSGLAVQGGTGTYRHLDAMLDELTFEAAERPRLVHRLDKDTSGVLLLARTAVAARWLAEAFRQGRVHKTYWALVAGVPRPRQGRIDLPLAKRPGAGREIVTEDEDGRRAATVYRTVDAAEPSASFVVLEPETGRTHQLRAHMAALGTPILGDGKYGGAKAILPGVARRLHLHARAIRLVQPDGDVRRIEAPLPAELVASWEHFGLAPADPSA